MDEKDELIEYYKNKKMKICHKKWFECYDFSKVNEYITKICEELKFNKNDLCECLKNIKKKNMWEIIEENHEKYEYKKKNNSGRYSTTFILNNKIMKNEKIIIKDTVLKNLNQLKIISKEIIIQYYLYKKINISPNIHMFYILEEKNKIKTYIGMDKVNYIFFQFFNIDKMYKFYKMKNTIVLDQFTLALNIYIGNLEKIILNGILHNDSHDGNFGFLKDGEIKFIDFGEAKIIEYYPGLIDNINNTINYDIFTNEINTLYCTYLYDELDYFIDMYYFDNDYNKKDKERYKNFYNSKKYSPVKNIFKLLKNNQYKFGYFLKYASLKLNIEIILNNFNKKNILKLL